MKRSLYICWIIGNLVLGSHAACADGPAPAPVCPGGGPLVCPATLLSGCPNDYCRKPCPFIPCLSPWHGPNDYCRKPCPFIPCLELWHGPNDYCRKPMPALCRPLCADHYICGPGCPSAPAPSNRGKQGAEPGAAGLPAETTP
jgi:hypothetical protein